MMAAGESAARAYAVLGRAAFEAGDPRQCRTHLGKALELAGMRGAVLYETGLKDSVAGRSNHSNLCTSEFR